MFTLPFREPGTIASEGRPFIAVDVDDKKTCLLNSLFTVADIFSPIKIQLENYQYLRPKGVPLLYAERRTEEQIEAGK